jgi:hypothetical protein
MNSIFRTNSDAGRTLARARRAAAVLPVLLALAAAACGGDGTGSDTSSVASVVITAPPPGPVLAGTSVQLVATPVNATGAVVSNARVTWKSSDVTIATVNGSGLVSVVGAGPVTITATCGTQEGSVDIDARAGGLVGPDSSTLVLLNGAIRLTTPAGSVFQPVTVLLRPALSVPQDARGVQGTAWELGPPSLVFNRAAQLTLAYKASSIPSGVAETSLQLHALSSGAWVPVRGSTVDPATHTVRGTVGGAATYMVAGTSANRVAIGGPAAGSALYVGQSTTLSAAAFDVYGDTIRGRALAWTTSDASRATVDGTGKVTALATGTVTITAALDGQQGTTTLSILSRPTPSWSQTADWTTLQGSARHTGYVAATLDPAAFHQVWTRTVAGGAQLNPLAVGGGHVFVSNNSYFGAQSLSVLSAATGSIEWTRDFGTIHSIDPPAYGNGRVYVMTGGHQDSFLWSFDAADGTLRTKTPYGNQWSRWGAPVVTSTGVYTSGGTYGGFYRFDATTGAQSYFVQLPQEDGWAPAVDEGAVYVYGTANAYYGGGLSVLNPATGSVSWSLADARLPTSGTPVLGGMNDLVTIAASQIISVNLGTQSVAWTLSGGFSGMPAVAANVIYAIGQGNVQARRESDGSLLWQWAPPSGGSPTGTMVVTNNLLFVSVTSGQFDQSTVATYAVDLASGKHVWTYSLGGELAMGKDGVLYIGGRGGRVAAIAVK